MLILLLESDRLLAKNIKKVFAKSGHRAVVIAQPETAINVADLKKPDLVIADLQLAGRSGVEFLFEFKSYPEWAEVPVIIYSNLPQIEARAYLGSLDKMNIKHYFHKPTTTLAQLEEAALQLVG